jgi:hypothetical protein
MWFESQEGIGSTFYFTIIVEKGQVKPLPSFGPEWKSSRVLVFDRSEAVTSLMARRLQSWGVQVATANSYKQALTILTNEDISIIIIGIFIKTEIILEVLWILKSQRKPFALQDPQNRQYNLP